VHILLAICEKFHKLDHVKDSAQHTFYKALGARIRELRGPLSQEQLAKIVKLTRTSIVNIEAGRQKLLLHNLFKIADALGVRPTELLSPLEPARGEIPVVKLPADIAGPVNRWVQRGVTKAIKSRSSRDSS
jgi:transcriptional regulator with XRE-family HTH domain